MADRSGDLQSLIWLSGVRFIHSFKRFCALAAVLCLAAASGLIAQSATPVPVLTWRYDLTHAGQNTEETLLTPANVNTNSFGKLFSLSVDSTVYAQPLYVPALKMIDGQVHNVLFVATENDSIYAFDADSNGGPNAKPIWQISLLTSAHGAGSGATAVPWQDSGSPDVAPTVGITGTPAINAATNTMYVVANTKENGQYYSRLHAINIINGAEQPNSPVDVTATVAGTGNGSSGGQISFSPLWENQRPALNYYNGYVYFGYGAHGDNGPWHGWLFAYDATTLKQTAALCLTPNGSGAGIWGSGAGMPIDSQGRMYLVTGNGTHSTYPPFNANTEFGESVVAFDISNGHLTPTDAFTSFNFQTLNNHDWDQGAGGVLMFDQSGPNPHILIQAGKEGRILVLNRDNLGGYLAGASSNTNALQDISNVIPPGVGFWSTPAYWNGNVYFWAENNVPMMFKMNNGLMNTQPDSKSTITSAFPDPTFSISSNGTQDGIAWAVRSDQFNTSGPGVLYAWDANDLTHTIYESDTNSARDAVGPANKFSVPVVTNGKVYVAAHGQVDVYGLINAQPQADAPVISPNGGSFTGSQNVTLTTSTATATIYYTLDGLTPTTTSTLYTAPITLTTDTVLKAMASAPGYVQSIVSSATFTFADQTPAPSLSPAAGTYVSAQTVTISDTDANAKIYYTVDGSTPTASSTLYTGPIQVAVSETIQAIAIDSSMRNSNVSTAAYVIQNGGSFIDFGTGFSSTAGLTLNGSAVATNDTRLQLTNGGTWQAGSVFWNTPINIQAFTTNFEFQLSNAQGNGFTFTIQNVAPTALGGNSAGLGYQDIAKSIAVKFNFYNYNGEGSDSTGIYTNGQAPVLPTVDISSSGIQLGSGDSIQAQITYDGTTLTLNLHDLVTSKTFTMSQAINIPQIVGGNTAYVGFTGGTGGLSSSQKLLTWTYATQSQPPMFAPAAGTYKSIQSVKLSSATSDAVIHYTTNGSTPTAASTSYSGPISVAASETIQAIAVSPTYGSSNVVSAAYVISLPAPTAAPVFSPAAGTYSSPQNVAISSASGDAVIHYTTDGSAPSAASTSYSGPISVAKSETIEAIAISPTSGSSAVVTAAYVIQPPAPASFTLTSSAAATVSRGASTTATITVTPSGGFTGTVTLSCAITSGPAGATNPPACSVTQPAPISGTDPVTTRMTVNTTGPTTPTAGVRLNRWFTLGGGGTVAAFLLFCIPIRRRKWLSLCGMLLLVAFAAMASGCSNTSGKVGGSKDPDPPVSSGTTAGNYTITVTGTSGSIQGTTTVGITVQ